MDRREFDQLLSRGDAAALPSVLLFEGEDEYLKQAALASLSRLLLPEGLEDLNRTVPESPETDRIIAAAETLPFMAERRLVILRDHPALSGRSETDDRLASYLPSVPSSAILLFYCQGKPDGRKKLYTLIKKMGGIVTFDPMRDRELTSYVTGTFREFGKECDVRTADLLIFICGNDAGLLRSEIAKIAAHAGDSPSIHPDSVRALATPSTECTVFQMVDAVVAGQSGRAFRLMRNQLRNGGDRVYMISMLLRQFRLLQHIRIMQYEKTPPAQIRSALGVPAFAAEQYIRQAGGYTNGQVRRASALCLETEAAVKSGKLPQEGALEALMLKLLNLRESR